jgi:type III restriction enzyme
MELKFNPNLDYQNDAIASVVNLFSGQEISHSNFTIYDPKYMHKKTVFGGKEVNYSQQMTQSFDGTEEIYEGVANKLELDNEEITENLKRVQSDSRLKPFNGLLKAKEYNFAIEMETGTGKTYVYLKTIFELSKNYGFKKFIILVPSVAIKEGVLASIRSMRSHFRYHYPNCLFNDFQYSSGKLSELMNYVLRCKQFYSSQ